jgi:hypothetical protein
MDGDGVEDRRPYLLPAIVIERKRMGEVGRKPNNPDDGEGVFFVTKDTKNIISKDFLRDCYKSRVRRGLLSLHVFETS